MVESHINFNTPFVETFVDCMRAEGYSSANRFFKQK